MASSIFDHDAPHVEPSSLVAFAGNRLDRRSEHRPDDILDQVLRVEGAHAFAIGRGRVILKHDRQTLDPLYAPYELEELSPDFENAVLLGYEKNGEPRLAVPVDVELEELPPLYKAVDYRSLYTQQMMLADHLGQLAQAASLVAWNLASPPLRPLRATDGQPRRRLSAGVPLLQHAHPFRAPIRS